MDALQDPKHKHHEFAKFYNNTLEFLQKRYKNYMRYTRPGYPKTTKGRDARGFDVPHMKKPTPPMAIPLKANVNVEGKLGKNLWACCLDDPTLLPGNLWDLGRRRSITIEEELIVNIEKEPDLAFFLYAISTFKKKNIIRLHDPESIDAEIGAEQELITKRKTAVWTSLTDEKKLRTVASAYNVAMVDRKQPNAIRQELEKILEYNDKHKGIQPYLKGTEELLEELHLTDALIMRSYVQKTIDDEKLAYRPDGRWKIGDKIIVQVPQNETKTKTEYLCSYLLAGNNAEKLKEFIHDTLTKEYLDNLELEKEWSWLFKVATGQAPNFKKKEEIKTRVRETFCPIG